jgi:hypothetical protein
VNSGGLLRRGIQIAVRSVGVGAALACFTLAAFVLTKPPRAAPPYVPPAAPSPASVPVERLLPAATGSPDVTALFVGDGYTAQFPGVPKSPSFATQACVTLKLVCNLDGQDLTGYQADGHGAAPGFMPYPSRLAVDAGKYTADLVVISGGREDLAGAGDEEAIVQAYLGSVRQAYPAAKIVVLEPFWSSFQPPDPILELRREVRRAAGANDVLYLRTSGWLSEDGIDKDGVHPNAEGHRELAEHLVTAFGETHLLAGLGGATTTTASPSTPAAATTSDGTSRQQ